MAKILLFFILVLLSGCLGIPEGVTPEKDFELERYLGTWYEIARLDHSFERGLEKVTAEYTLREDDGIKVVNRGFDPVNNSWTEAIGRAYFLEGPGTGMLKVSFFGPFYASYNIMALDKLNYSYAVVCGPNKDYLWILSREPFLDEEIKTDLVKKAKDLGFKIEELIFVVH